MSDLIDELLNSAGQNDILGEITYKGAYGVLKYELDVDEQLSNILKKHVGHYVTIKVKQNFLWSHKISKYISNMLKNTIQNYLKKANLSAPFVLVVGLGNGNMVCDSLGDLVCRNLCVVDKQTAQQLNNGCISYLLPSVEGLTGINSFDLVQATIKTVKPNCVVVIDSLTATNVNRLGLTFQCSDAGISPGGGVGNGRHYLNKACLGVPVLSLGVPLLINVCDLCSCNCQMLYNYFTPKEIDFVIKKCASIISRAINQTVYSPQILDVYK